MIYDRSGNATLLHAGTPEHDGLVDVAERLAAAAGGPPERGAADG